MSCIADNQKYLVKDPELIKAIFGLVKAKIKNESLVLTPNMIRFLALKLIKNDENLLIKIKNIAVSSSKRARLVTRGTKATLLRFLSDIFVSLPYAVAISLIYFDITQNCSYRC